jgi:hypothetical protein
MPGQIDHLIFYLFRFERGLVRVQIESVLTKYGHPGPLLNGSVVSEQCLPDLLKQTVCNVARRKAVEVEKWELLKNIFITKSMTLTPISSPSFSYQMTHMRRKQAIAEFGRRFATRLEYTEFVEHLLSADMAALRTTAT